MAHENWKLQQGGTDNEAAANGLWQLEKTIMSVEKSPRHKRQREIWMADLHMFEVQTQDAVEELRRLRAELYQIITMSLIFEGVVFTAVAQTTNLNCSLWWSPVGLVLSVAAAACFGVAEKCRAIGETEDEHNLSDGNTEAIIKALGDLDRRGDSLDLDADEGRATSNYKSTANQKIRSPSAIFAFASLICFSIIISIFCNSTLCRRCKPCPA